MNAPNEIVSTRLLNYPRQLVFSAWTNPDHLARWWGPQGFTNTFHEFDLRPGGHWRLVMHGPNGANYDNQSVFQEIIEPERIVLDHVSAPAFRLTATFEDCGEQTQLVWVMRFDSAEMRDKVAPIAIPANEQNFDRLEAVLSDLVKLASA